MEMPWLETSGTENITNAIRTFQHELPGWWWSIGVCSVSADASCGPDVKGPDAGLLKHRQFDDGFHADLRQPATCAEALMDVMGQAKAAIAKLGNRP